MFNDLTGAQDKAASKVDDIFAETDKASASGNGSQIETRPAGLSATAYPARNASSEEQLSYDDGEDEPGNKGNKIMKIAIFAAIGAIVILGGYLAYSKFLAPQAEKETEITPNSIPAEEENSEPVKEEKDDSFVTPISNKEVVASSTEEEPLEGEVSEENSSLLDSDSDGLSDSEEAALGTDQNLIDSDGDILNDYAEVKEHKTDPLKLDSDGDTLSDYEEINNWGTDPLNPDTDGDGYRDADEIKSGYNPRGEGKLPGTVQ